MPVEMSIRTATIPLRKPNGEDTVAVVINWAVLPYRTHRLFP